MRDHILSDVLDKLKSNGKPTKAVALEPNWARSYLFWLILAVALIIRVYLALTTVYIWDEERDWIPGALTISFDSEDLNLPLRMKFHGALPAYFIKLSEELFGQSHFGFRILGICFGLGTIVVVTVLAGRWAGSAAALWAAALMAFNEYHILFSYVAIQKTYYLFFVTLSLATFCRALMRDDPRWLYAMAVATGLAFLCYEIAIFLIPIYAITTLLSKHRQWLMRPHPYLAGLIFLIIILPDFMGNYFQESNLTGSASYSDHLARLGGLGFIKHYFLFYLMEPACHVYHFFDWHLDRVHCIYNASSNKSGYSAVNGLFGVLLFLCVIDLDFHIYFIEEGQS